LKDEEKKPIPNPLIAIRERNEKKSKANTKTKPKKSDPIQEDDGEFMYQGFSLVLFIASLVSGVISNLGFFLSLIAAAFISVGMFFGLNVFFHISIKGVRLRKIHGGQDVFYGAIGIIVSLSFISLLTFGLMYPPNSSSSSSSSSGYSYCARVAEDDLRDCMNRSYDESEWRRCERNYNYTMAGCTATE
tara:strand:- start:207 stop:773 length:567 start_codon:yes stop_codon:yes gene_type:complete